MNDYTPYILILNGLVQLVALIGGFWKAVTAVNNMSNKIGSKYPREGLLGDVEAIKEKQDADHEKIVVIEANVAQRRTTDKK